MSDGQNDGSAYWFDLADDVGDSIKEPPKYKVIFLNDDFTPMDFVALMIMTEFGKSAEDAISLTYEIHEKGKSVVGIYPKDIAETKIHQVELIARNQGHPLKCIIESDLPQSE